MTAEDRAVFCYCAAKPGEPGYHAVVVDRPEWKKDTAKTIAKWVRGGADVSRVPLEAARDGLSEYLAWKKESRK